MSEALNGVMGAIITGITMGQGRVVVVVAWRRHVRTMIAKVDAGGREKLKLD